MARKHYDFSGWATRNNLRCSDGRTIRKDAFKDNDGQTVPLVWNHNHNDPLNVLGHALLENRNEGVYAYCTFNDTEAGQNAKLLVQHGDVTALSIYANKLRQNGGDVIHGAIREVSLVLAGANPGAYIDAVLSHGEVSDDEAIIYTDEDIYIAHSDDEYDTYEKEERMGLRHADEEDQMVDDGEETVADVFNTLSEKQKQVVYAIIGQAVEDAKKEGSMQHADDEDDEDGEDETVADVFNTLNEKQKTVVYALIGQALEDAGAAGGDESVKHNVFDDYEEDDDVTVLSHSDMEAIFSDAKRYGSLKDSALEHGIDNIEYLFPDAKNISDKPDWLKREDEWVTTVMNGTHHTPFSRIKSMYADITEADARAKGYIKGNMKKDEVFALFKRTTDPQTVYKKQKLERDDVTDITDFDVVAWLKAEMRMMLDEEIARAILIGDGRNPVSEDKIFEDHIRPIWTDADVYTIKAPINVSSSATADQKAKAFIRAAVKSRKDYKGSGNPVLFTTEDVLTDCLLMEDNMGRVIYDTEEKLRTALRVSKIVTVPVMENQTREVNGHTNYLWGIIVNLNDYNVGADKGGAVNMFDDFDIDFNAMKYLIETRCSGALTKPYSAIALELVYNLVLSLDAEAASGTVLGKAVSDLQSDVVVHDNYIKGNLKYVTNFTGYSQDTSENFGNFIALKFTATEGATTTIQIIGRDELREPTTLDSDMNAVIRIVDKNKDKLKVVTTTTSGETLTKIYSFANLRCANA